MNDLLKDIETLTIVKNAVSKGTAAPTVYYAACKRQSETKKCLCTQEHAKASKGHRRLQTKKQCNLLN